jgi:ABC-type uncharacterized transport system involved in gliding motility auxiliary subunit
MNRRLVPLAALALLLVLFFAINVLSAALLRSARLDLTEQRIYTLSDGSRRIAASIDEPIRLYLYFSRSLATGRPVLQNYGRRVREMLEEYVRASDGSIVLEIIDPEPFSEAEDEATRAGLAGVPMGAGNSFFLGLVGRNAVDGEEVLPFLDPSQEQFLEYEVSRMVYSLANPQRKVVGVISSLPMNGAPPNPMQPQPQRPWHVITEIGRLFEVRTLDLRVASIPDDVDVLLLVHPKSLPPSTLFAIDQHVLGGGKAVVFVDPICESDIPPGAQQNPMAAFEAQRSSNLPRLFEAWGVELDDGGVACDLSNAQRVAFASGGRREEAPYVGWISLGADEVDQDDAITGRLSQLNVATAGILRHRPEATTDWTPLVRTSPESMRADATRFMFMPDPKGLLTDFEPGGEPFVVAARITGNAVTAFPDGPPPPAEGAEAIAPPGPHLTESTGPIHVFVFADVDMLTDRFWLREETLFGQIPMGYRKLADNGDLLVNALDNMAGSSDLISVGARGRYSRPFTLVQEVQQEAEREYRAEEQRLQDRLAEAERNLNELQQAKPDSGRLILTPEQQAELARFNEQRIETRKQLRAVRLNLRKDIEWLGVKWKAINIAAMPLAVALFAIGLWVFQLTRRRQDRRAVAQT